LSYLRKIYWSKLREMVSMDERLKKTIPGFLLQPKEIVLYLGPFHLGVEYLGSERFLEPLKEDLSFDIRFFDLSETGESFLNKVIGIDYVGAARSQFSMKWRTSYCRRMKPLMNLSV
jgi:hypothetical protein